MMTVKETPPDDDVCPICFGDYVLPYRALCGHWFCGSCILQLWRYGNATHPCKCPLCNRLIKVFTPGVSLNQQDWTNKDEIRKVAKSIERYNRLFVGGARGCLMRVCESPFFIKRTLQDMVDPTQVDAHYGKWQILSLLLACLYMISPFNFIPKLMEIREKTPGPQVIATAKITIRPLSAFVIWRLVLFSVVSVSKWQKDKKKVVANLLAFVIVTLVKAVGWYTRRRSAERVRWLAAAEFDPVLPERETD